MRSDTRSKVVLGLLGCLAAVLAAVWIFHAVTSVLLDIDVYRQSGVALRHGCYLYGPASTAHRLPFLYSPFAALVFVPASLLTAEVIRIVWTLLLLGALLAFCRISFQYIAPQVFNRHRYLTSVALLGVALALEPIWQNFNFGQINIVVGLAVLLDLAQRSGRIPTGVLTGMAAAVKLTPLIFAVYWFFTGRRKDAYVALVTFTICTVLGFIVAWHSSLDYWGGIAYDSNRVGAPFATNQTFNGFFLRFLGGPEHVTTFWKALSALLGLSGFILAVRTARLGDQVRADLICAVTALLASPISWTHHWVWVVPVLVWLTYGSGSNAITRAGAIIATVLFIYAPTQHIPKGNNTEYSYSVLQTLGTNSYTILGILFVVAAGFAASSTSRLKDASADASLRSINRDS